MYKKESKVVGQIEMLISLDQKNHLHKSLAKQISDFDRNKGLVGKFRSFGSVKLVLLCSKGLKGPVQKSFQKIRKLPEVDFRTESKTKKSPVAVVSFGNEKKETKPGKVVGDVVIWGDRIILGIADAFDIIEITVFSGKYIALLLFSAF